MFYFFLLLLLVRENFVYFKFVVKVFLVMYILSRFEDVWVFNDYVDW